MAGTGVIDSARQEEFIGHAGAVRQSGFPHAAQVVEIIGRHLGALACAGRGRDHAADLIGVVETGRRRSVPGIGDKVLPTVRVVTKSGLADLVAQSIALCH